MALFGGKSQFEDKYRDYETKLLYSLNKKILSDEGQPTILSIVNKEFI